MFRSRPSRSSVQASPSDDFETWPGTSVSPGRGTDGFAELAVAQLAPKRAATIRRAAARLREKIGIPIPFNEEADYKRAVTTTRIALGDDGFDEPWREGNAMELEEAVRYTLNGRVAGGT